MEQVKDKVQRVLDAVQKQAHSTAAWTKNIDFPHHLYRSQAASVRHSSHDAAKGKGK